MKIIFNCTVLILYSSSVMAQCFERIENSAQLQFLKNTTGVAVADYDQDHDLDIFIVGKNDFSQSVPSSWSRLLSNNNDGTFEDVTLESGFENLHNYDLKDPGWAHGVKLGASWGDYDNDGYPDLFLTNYRSFQLFHNEGNGSFLERTVEAGFPKIDSCYNHTALWWDLDKDGYLDIFIPNWLGCTGNKFYQNNGDGTFSEKAEELNLSGTKEGGLMSVPIDANNDGLWDLYIANDYGKNELFIQNPDFIFEDKAAEYLVDYYGNDMGMAIGDYNNDGHFDIYLTNISENRLLTPSGNNTYKNLAGDKNVFNTYWGWDARFADFDLDGDEDLFVLNGYENDLAFHKTEKENFYFKNLLIEKAQANFRDHSKEHQVHESSNSFSMAVFDYDNDGDQDVLVSQADNHPFFYENKITNSDPNNDPTWVNISLEGTRSNRDGLGSQIKIWIDGRLQNRLYYGAGFLSQSLQPVHFGLGDAKIIDSLELIWNSGITEKYYDLAICKNFHFTETQSYTLIEKQHKKIYGCTDINSCNYNEKATVNDGSCAYYPMPKILGATESGYLKEETYSCSNNSSSTYSWNIKHGKIISGQGSSKVKIRWGLEDKGAISVVENNQCNSDTATLEIALSIDKMQNDHSVARLWNEALLFAIRNDYARPTVHARNLFHTSVAMYDAWAIFNENAQTYFIGNKLEEFESTFNGFLTNENKEAALIEAISFAAFRLLHHRFSKSPGAKKSKMLFNHLLLELGFDISNTSLDYSTGDPAALGNYIAQTLIDFGLQDGANESNAYANEYYQAVNPPLVTDHAGNPKLKKPNRWQALALETFIDQAGNLIDGSTHEFLSPEWGNVIPFSLNDHDKNSYERDYEPYSVYHDPGPPPYLDTLVQTEISGQYQWGFSLVSIWGAQLSPDDGILWDISPQSMGNVSRLTYPKKLQDYDNFYYSLKGGTVDKGRAINPSTNKAYQEQMVLRGDYTRVLAEYWADGPASETPPGHWYVLLNNVSDHPLLEKKLGGKGRIVSDLEWDLKSYFILGGTMHDAAIAAWSNKGWYDYIRPISAIRYMAEQGQSTDSTLPNYKVGGIPLIEGFIEMVNKGDELEGTSQQHVGKIKLYSWKGHQYIADTKIDAAGVGWILAENWMPYQRPSFVTPPFSGYVSGHSTYSRAAAEVLTLITGDAYFPGGMGEFMAYQNEFLKFENGPSENVKLQWATYRDASDQCSLSRIWGGIHPPADDIPGRIMGEKIGKDAFEYATSYFSKNSPNKDQLTSNPSYTIHGNDILRIKNVPFEKNIHIKDIHGRNASFTVLQHDHKSNFTSIQLHNVTAGIYFIKSELQTWKLIVVRSY